MYKRMRSLAMAQRYGMRCQIALKKKHIKEDLQEKKNLTGALLNILKTEDN